MLEMKPFKYISIILFEQQGPYSRTNYLDWEELIPWKLSERSPAMGRPAAGRWMKL